MSATKYAWVGVTSARSSLAYVGEVVARTVFLAVILYIFLQLWRTTFEQTGEERLGGLTLSQMLWYLGLTESLVLSTPAIAYPRPAIIPWTVAVAIEPSSMFVANSRNTSNRRRS